MVSTCHSQNQTSLFFYYRRSTADELRETRW